MHPTAHHALVTGGTETLGLAAVRREAVQRGKVEPHHGVVFERVDLPKSAQVVDLFDRLPEMGRSPCEEGPGYITGQCLPIDGGLN